MRVAGGDWSIVLVLLTAFWLYLPVFQSLFHDWSNDDNYSHGFLIVPLAAYFAWERRERLQEALVRPSVVGLAGVVAGLAMLVAGILGAEFFVSRVSVLVVLAGSIVYLWGWQYLRILAFPVLFLLLMIPIPAIIFNQIAFPLQLFASRFGTSVMQAVAVPVLREGNVIVLANTTLEVAEACSGIRSLISLITLGIVYGYFVDSRPLVRALIVACTIPIAIVANGLRVAGTGILAHNYGVETALGFFHTFSGWLVFAAAFGLLLLVVQGVRWLAPSPPVTMTQAVPQ
jgi:exosortase